MLCEAVAAFGVRDDENKNETVPGVNASGTASLRILADTPAGTTRMQMALTTRSSKPICESACNKSYGVRISNQDGTRALQRTDKVKALDCRDVCTQVHAPYTIMNDASASSLLPNRRP